MVAGADSIDDLGVIRHGALPGIFGGIRAPSTLGTFLRGFTWGNVRQLDAVARETLTGLSRQAPLLPGAGSSAFLDVDSTISRVYGYAKQGADYGYTRVRGLHPLLATISTPIAAPVIAGTRLRRGSAGSAKGAASFVAEAITTARQAGATGVLLARMDSAFDSHAVVSTCVRAGVRFSITTKQTRPVRAAIDAITEDAWVPIAYPQAVYDEASGQWISDAEIAETTYTAFRSRRKSEQMRVRLIVRRVKDKNVVAGQGELFTAWRYHAFITDSTLQLVQTEKQHREHAIIEQVNADLKDSALAHLPSVIFSSLIDHDVELGRCVVDGVGGVAVGGCSQQGLTSFADLPFGVSWSPRSPRMSAIRCSPSARARASRSCWLSCLSRRMRSVAACRRCSSEASVAR
jgi:hypothetical protein